MKHDNYITPISRIVTREAERRRTLRQAELAAEARAAEQSRKIVDAWSNLRTTLLAEISAANMLLTLHKLDEQFSLTDHSVREASKIAQFDLSVGRSVARSSICASSGQMEVEHFAEGLPTFLCKRFKLNCLTATPEQMQDVMGVLLASAFRQADEGDAR